MTLYHTLLCRSPEWTDLSTAPTTSNKDKVLQCFQEFLDTPNHEDVDIVDFFKKADVDMIDFFKNHKIWDIELSQFWKVMMLYTSLTKKQQESLQNAGIPFLDSSEIDLTVRPNGNKLPMGQNEHKILLEYYEVQSQKITQFFNWSKANPVTQEAIKENFSKNPTDKDSTDLKDWNK